MTQHPMTLQYADWLAGHVVTRISPFLKRVEIAGSIRRRRPQVGDIEIVAEPHLNPDLFAGHATPVLDDLRKSLSEIGTLLKNGDRYIQAHLTKTDQKLDLFLVWPPANWGSILAIRTGPARLGQYVVTHCRESRIMHTQGHAVHMDTGEILTTATEADFFALAGVECVPPEDRDALADRLLAGGSSPG